VGNKEAIRKKGFSLRLVPRENSPRYLATVGYRGEPGGSKERCIVTGVRLPLDVVPQGKPVVKK